MRKVRLFEQLIASFTGCLSLTGPWYSGHPKKPSLWPPNGEPKLVDALTWIVYHMIFRPGLVWPCLASHRSQALSWLAVANMGVSIVMGVPQSLDVLFHGKPSIFQWVIWQNHHFRKSPHLGSVINVIEAFIDNPQSQFKLMSGIQFWVPSPWESFLHFFPGHKIEVWQTLLEHD